tara:strand:- start:1004 stop:1387 length:384 start_codon:yes stop_codon:yes gene_type:complete
MLKVGQVVELKKEFKTPTCKKGVCSKTGRDFAAYKILSIKKVNCVAFNMGTLMVQILRMEHLVLREGTLVDHDPITFDKKLALERAAVLGHRRDKLVEWMDMSDAQFSIPANEELKMLDAEINFLKA